MFKTLNSRLIYEDKWIKFFKDDIEFPDGSKGTYSWVDRKSGVGIVIVNKNKEILLNKEYRYPSKKYFWEIPGGGIDAGETSERAAIREVEEETGIKVTKVEKLGTFYPLASFNTETVTIFLATTDSTPSETQGFESSEFFGEHKFVPIQEALRLIDAGEMESSLTSNAIQLVARKLS